MTNYDDQVENMMDELLPILEKRESKVGYTAMTCLMIENVQKSGISKQEFMDEISRAWDHYYKQRLCNNCKEPA